LSNAFSECKGLIENGADYLHLDVMDGHFCDNITFGQPVVKCLRQNIGKEPFFDMHMMVEQPEKHVVSMAEAGATQFTFHYEATKNVGECIRKIKENGMKCGLAIKPNTPAEAIVPFMGELDMALVMTVEPGKGGQKFMQDMLPKVKFLRERFHDINIQVDGGVSLDNIKLCAEYGANMVVAGTSLLKSADRRATIKEMQDLINTNLRITFID
jgi:ribulose-phosphate 3-epimerase